MSGPLAYKPNQCISQAHGDELFNAIRTAILCGYRSIDTAYAFDNEEVVGKAIASMIQEGSVQREDLFVIDKLWNTSHRPDLVLRACEDSLSRLKLDYIDLYLMHWPLAFKEDQSSLYPRDEESQEIIQSEVDFVDTWASMTRLVDMGIVRSIGISNFNESQLDRLLRNTSHIPAAIQIECHPYLTQKPLTHYCMQRRIQVISFSPLGTPNRPNGLTGEPNLFANKTVLDIASALGKTCAQVLIRYQIERGHAVLAKSVTAKRIASNCQVFDFELSAEHMEALNQLNYGRRFVTNLQ